MSSRFFTNHGEQTLFKKFQGVFESNPDIEWFDALVGYLRSSGYFALRPYLENVPHIRILVGINVDAIMADYQANVFTWDERSRFWANGLRVDPAFLQARDNVRIHYRTNSGQWTIQHLYLQTHRTVH